MISATQTTATNPNCFNTKIYLTVKTYLPFEIVEFPKALFSTRGSFKESMRLQWSIFNDLVQQMPTPERTMQELQWYPEVVANMLTSGVMTPEMAAPLLNEPTFGFRVLVKDKGHLVSWLEPRLLVHAEAAELILAWRRQAARGPTQADAAYLECMIDDPNRLIRSLMPSQESTSRIAQLVHESASRKSESPAWAFCYLNNTPSVALDSELLAVLATDDEYAYLAARILRDRGNPESVWAPLLDHVQKPRWVFHILRDGLAGSKVQHFEEALMSSPPWMVEYWVATGTKMPELGPQYLETGRRSADHPCVGDLAPWFREYVTKQIISED